MINITAINELPDDIWKYIAEHLDIVSLYYFRITCTRACGCISPRRIGKMDQIDNTWTAKDPSARVIEFIQHPRRPRMDYIGSFYSAEPDEVAKLILSMCNYPEELQNISAFDLHPMSASFQLFMFIITAQMGKYFELRDITSNYAIIYYWISLAIDNVDLVNIINNVAGIPNNIGIVIKYFGWRNFSQSCRRLIELCLAASMNIDEVIIQLPNTADKHYDIYKFYYDNGGTAIGVGWDTDFAIYMNIYVFNAIRYQSLKLLELFLNYDHLWSHEICIHVAHMDVNTKNYREIKELVSQWGCSNCQGRIDPINYDDEVDLDYTQGGYLESY